MTGEPRDAGLPAGGGSVPALAAAGPRVPRAVAPVLAATLGLAAVSWVVAVWRMREMDMGVATRPGSFGFFIAVWVVMMTAMMLPGAAPAIARHAALRGAVRAALAFAGSYLALWALAGAVAYALDRPHGPLAAGVVVAAAGAYELTPVKRHFRLRCQQDARSGLRFGLCCAGSSIGLMAMLVALGVMSLFWMPAITVLICAQKLLPARPAIDVPLALALIGFGLTIIIGPSLIPGLMPPAL
jgi:predicted metal-binding membrane protein